MCTDLIKLMQSYNVLQQFLLKCIDDMQQIPAGLERVPTLIVVGINKPLIGREALVWFDGIRQSLPIQSQSSSSGANLSDANSTMQNKQILYNINKQEQITNLTQPTQPTQPNKQINPNGYSTVEHIGLSDNYAYTNSDNPLPKTFCEYGNDTNIIYTPPLEKTKLSKFQQEKTIKNLLEDRIIQEKSYIVDMKKKQIDMLIHQEQLKLQAEKNELNKLAKN